MRFSSTATTLGAGAGWSRYYDMLVESDVADLKAQVATLTSSGSTNWEDGMFRMFMNSDGTTQQVLPDTLIFFTDGMPTYNRLNATSATASRPWRTTTTSASPAPAARRSTSCRGTGPTASPASSTSTSTGSSACTWAAT